MRVILHLEGCACKLLFLVVECAPSFGINPVVVLSNHCGQTIVRMSKLDPLESQRRMMKFEPRRAYISTDAFRAGAKMTRTYREGGVCLT